MKINYKIKEWDNILRKGDYFTITDENPWTQRGFFKNRMYVIDHMKGEQPWIKWKHSPNGSGAHCFTSDTTNVLKYLIKIHPKDYHKYKLTIE